MSHIHEEERPVPILPASPRLAKSSLTVYSLRTLNGSFLMTSLKTMKRFSAQISGVGTETKVQGAQKEGR